MTRREWNRRRISDRMIRSRPRVFGPTKRRRGEASLLVLGCEAEGGELRNVLKRKALWLAKGGGGAIDERDAPTFPEPPLGRAPLDLAGGLSDQADDDPQGESPARVAVTAGLRRTRLAPVDRQPDDQPRDGRTTEVVGIEHLGEEQAGGHQG